MKLLAAFLSIVEEWQAVFPQQRTYQRAVRQALGSLTCLGRHCLSRIIWTNGGQHRSWSAEYFFTPAAIGNRNSYSNPFSSALWPIAHNGWSAWPWMTLSCARQAARFNRRSISAIRSPTLSCQPGVGVALSSGLSVGALALYGQRRHSRLAHSLSRSLSAQASRQEGQPRGTEAI